MKSFDQLSLKEKLTTNSLVSSPILRLRRAPGTQF